MLIGDNLDLIGLHADATKMLERAENCMATYTRISREAAKEGDRIVNQMRAAEFKKDADTIRRLMDIAFAA